MTAEEVFRLTGNEKPVMLWDLPAMCVGYDMANNGDFHVFTVAIPPDFVGEKKFIFASPTKDVEVTVKTSGKAMKEWGNDATDYDIFDIANRGDE